MSEPRYFLDHIKVGTISADCIHYDWDLQEFVFKEGGLTAEDHYQRAGKLISQLEEEINAGKY